MVRCFVNAMLHPVAAKKFVEEQVLAKNRFEQDPVGYFGRGYGVDVSTSSSHVLAFVKRLWTLEDPDAHMHMDRLLNVRSLGYRPCGKRVLELCYLGCVRMPDGGIRSPSPVVILTEEEMETIWQEANTSD